MGSSERRVQGAAARGLGRAGAPLAERIADVGELVVASGRIEPGMKVLDVAGTGNASLPAARAARA